MKLRNEFRGLACAGLLAVSFATHADSLQDREAILETFELHPDFQLELVAMEPVVFDPVDMEFDEYGRAFVMEMPGYPFADDRGSVVLLEDTDNDGNFDKRTVFATGFPVADSILPWRGGILVASPPDLVFVKDTDGDNVADVREVLLTGLSSDNTQHNFNGLTYGLDNWIYAANGGNAGTPYWPGKEDEAIRLGWNDFRVDLDNQIFEKTGASSGGFELAIDDYGRVFGTHNTQHISHLVMPGHYAEGLDLGWGDTRTQISDHEQGGLARIYPIGEQVTRVNHPEQSGFFSGACGITYYGGGAFPEGFNGNMFVCDVVLNLIHRDVINADGATFTASRGRDGVEFLASSDRAFRPVNTSVGPDGALFVLDMYRPVIEHPEWIPDEIEKDLDVNAGKDKGRILRITPKGGLPRETVSFDRNDLEGVVAKLTHPNQWHRLTAQRLLVEWDANDAVPALEVMATDHAEPRARVHALQTLAGMESLSDDVLVAALKDSEAGIRQNALVLAESRLQSDAVVQALCERANDDNTRVRMQTALVLGAVNTGAATKRAKMVEDALVTLARENFDDQWVRTAVVSAYRERPMALARLMLQPADWNTGAGATELLAMLTHLVGRDAPAADVGETLELLAKASGDTGKTAGALNGLAEGLRERPGTEKSGLSTEAIASNVEQLMQHDAKRVVEGVWSVADAIGLPPTPTQDQLLEEAAHTVADRSADTQERLDSLAVYAFAPFERREETLFALLNTREPRELQRAAMEQLADVGNDEVAQQILARWDTLSPDVRVLAGNMFLRRPALHDTLLTALEEGPIRLGEMNFDLERRRALLFSNNEEVKRRAEALFSDAGVVTRKAALDAMRPALELEGDPVKGHLLYTELCAKCHVMGEEGVDLAPNLTEIARKSAETLLHDILDPNAAVDAEYISYSVQTKGEDAFGGELVTGIIAGESPQSVTLREAGGAERVINRDDIVEMRSTGLSLMPEEMEAGLTPQDMANLLAFLQQPR